LSGLTFARAVQFLYLLVGLACLSLLSHADVSDAGKYALLAVGSLMTAVILIGLKCHRCGYSMYRTPNYRINLLVPAARACAHCGASRN